MENGQTPSPVGVVGHHLARALVETPRRESAGPRTANRFDYQKSWALCHLLELHSSGDDYVVLFDFHEDVVVLDSSANPSRLTLFQVKTKDSPWTCAALIRRPRRGQERGSSVLGKLHQGLLAFAEWLDAACLVSNAPYKIALRTGQSSIERETITLAELDPRDGATVRRALQQELNLSGEPGGDNVTHLMRTTLSVNDHRGHALGRFTQFLQKLAPGARVAVVPLFQTLCDEVSRLTDQELSPETFHQLCERKGLSRHQLQAMLGRAINSPDTPSEIRDQLRSESVPFREVQQLCAGAAQFLAQRDDPSEDVIRRAAMDVQQSFKARHYEGESFIGLITEVLRTPPASLAAVVRLKGEAYAKGLVAVILHE